MRAQPLLRHERLRLRTTSRSATHATCTAWRAPLICLACLACLACTKPRAEAPPSRGAQDRATQQAAEHLEARQRTQRGPHRLVLRYEGLRAPESVLYDPRADVYLVSNVAGSPFGLGENGFISKLSPDGTMLDAQWIGAGKDGVRLRAPKGLALDDAHLYVADVDAVRVFDRGTGAPAGVIKVPGAKFLNDVAVAPDGAVYVTDTGIGPWRGGGSRPDGDAQAIYRVALGSAPVAVAKGSWLREPNGVVADAGGLWVVTLGSNELLRVVDGKETARHTLPTGTLDGIVALDSGRLLISSWGAATVFEGPPAGPFTPAVEHVDAPADIGFDTKRNRLLVPLFRHDAVEVYDFAPSAVPASPPIATPPAAAPKP